MKNWSKYQQSVFENIATGTGHTVVNAVAGSGKTTTVEHGVNHVPPGCRVLFVAFNKPTADELAKRIKNAEVSTLHSYSLKCITASLGRLKINQYRTEDFARELYRKQVNELEKASKKDPSLRVKIRLISDRCYALAKTAGLAKGALASTEEQIDAILDRHEIDVGQPIDGDDAEADRIRFVDEVLSLLMRCSGTEDGQIDFDDMIWLPIVRDLPQRKFDRVFVDETQDLNACQIQLVLRAVKPEGRICAVGDPRQAIYQFRGADEHAFENVKTGLGAVELPLSVCYRCCKAVIREAQKIVPNIEAAQNAEEGQVTRVQFTTMQREAKPGDFVVSRTNAPLVSLCMRFLMAGIPANIQGRDVGKSLSAFVQKSGAKTIPELRDYTTNWCDEECARLSKKRRDTQSVQDRAACILAVSDGASSVQEVLNQLEAMFSDKKETSFISLSTTHKAKGLERDRVWLLDWTFRRAPGVEEDNLYYVAVTRARKALFLVEQPKKDEE